MNDASSRPSAGVVIRSVIYQGWLFGLLAIQGVAFLPLLAGPRAGVMWAARTWAKTQLWGLKVIVGIRVEVRGLEHRPVGAGLIAAKHQGQLDTIAPFAVLPDPCFVLKRELSRLPVFGWYAIAGGMIPVDRGGGSKAVRALSAAAEKQLARAPRQILIFPEGTRQHPGAPPHYKSGVAALYRDLELPCTPMATNSGLFWPPKSFIRRPGVVVFEFLPAIPPGLKRAEFMRELQERIETASDALSREALRVASPPQEGEG